MDSIDDMWKRFSLSDKEVSNVDLEHTAQQSENILVAKFLTTRVLNIDSVARTFKPLWKTRRSFTVQDLGKNRVAFVFEEAMDLERVLVNEPWSFDKSLVVFQRLLEDGPINDALFSHVSFWVKLHNLPIQRRTEEAATAIGRSIGYVEKVAASDDERGGENCMRIRVRVDVTRPLCRGRLVKLEVRKTGWVAFRYERLPNFCYWCGLFDHGEKDCDIGLRQRNADSVEVFQFGAWLRASSDRPPRKTVVTVPGNLTSEQGKSTSEDSWRHPMPTTSEPQAPPDCHDRVPEFTPPNFETDMEVEQNPGPKYFTPQCKSTLELFNDQLREIDQAINYIPEKDIVEDQIPALVHDFPTHTPAVLTPSPQFMQSDPLPRIPLGDISNGLTSPPRPKRNTAKWKKLARASNTRSAGPSQAHSLKRAVVFIEEEPGSERKKRAATSQCAYGSKLNAGDVCESNAVKISAEAGYQPCREP